MTRPKTELSTATITLVVPCMDGDEFGGWAGDVDVDASVGGRILSVCVIPGIGLNVHYSLYH